MRRVGSVLGLRAAALLLAALPLAGQALPDAEGPLDNDVFLPTARQGLEQLERGDAALAEARTDLDRLKAFEAWRAALASSSPGETVPRSERDVTGIEEALWARLRALAPELRAEWTERFADLADGDLADAGRDPDALIGAARRNPVTPAAARACLRLADLELERGAPLESAGWCRRASRQLELLESPHEALSAAIAARLEVALDLELEPADGKPPAAFGSEWETATSLRYLARIDHRGQPISRELPGPEDPGPPTGPVPGLVFLADGRIAIQALERVTVVSAAGMAIDSSFEPTQLLPEELAIPAARAWFGDDRHWSLVPATTGEDVLIVHGLPFVLGSRPNALMSIRPPGPLAARSTSRPSLPTLNWAVVGGRRVDASGAVHDEPELEHLQEAVFEPGPIVVGTRVLASLREVETEVSSWLACFDAMSGRCLWTRLIAKGSALQPGTDGRSGPRAPVPSQPLAAAGLGVFVGTNLGAGVLVDALDGRIVWGFRGRRRPAGSRGWTANWAPPVAEDPDGEPLFLWAPIDSDHEYLLSGGLRAPEAGPLRREPRAVGEGLALLGGDALQSIQLSLAGSRRVVSSWRARDGSRFDSPFLGREERFAGSGAVSAARVLVATDRGVWLLDRERELFLLDYAPFPPAPIPTGGSVRARGARVFVVGEAGLWTFAAE